MMANWVGHLKGAVLFVVCLVSLVAIVRHGGDSHWRD